MLARWMMAVATVAAVCDTAAAAGVTVGSGEAVFAKFAPTFGLGRAGFTPQATTVRLPTADGSVDIELSDSELDAADNYFAANGHVAGKAGRSDFMMKGTPADVYGWVTLDTEGKAYEYTAEADGTVVVRAVPLREVKPDCGF